MRNDVTKQKGSLEVEGSVRVGGPSGPVISGTGVSAGKSGTAGTVSVFPSTASKGKTAVVAADNAGDTTNTVTNDSMAGARTISYPDPGHDQTTKVKLRSLPERYRREWVAGQRGKPGVNADILSSTEATRMVADPDFEVLGTNASSDDVTFYAEGGIQLQTDGAASDSVVLLPHLDADQSAWTQVTWGTDQKTRWECRVKTGSGIGGTILWAGLKLTLTYATATDDDQVFFRYENGVDSGNWQAVSSIGGTDDAADTGVTVAASTDYHLVIDIDADRIARFYINGVLVKTTTALTDAVDLIPYIGVRANAVAEAKSIIVRGQAIERDFA